MASEPQPSPSSGWQKLYSGRVQPRENGSISPQLPTAQNGISRRGRPEALHILLYHLHIVEATFQAKVIRSRSGLPPAQCPLAKQKLYSRHGRLSVMWSQLCLAPQTNRVEVPHQERQNKKATGYYPTNVLLIKQVCHCKRCGSPYLPPALERKLWFCKGGKAGQEKRAPLLSPRKQTL